MNLIFLPATAPGDTNYGMVPDRIEGFPYAVIHAIQYQRLVWYNESVRDEAIAQIRALGLSPIVLVGFSKSGLGAWNIARTVPDLVSATIIFDAPVARQTLPTWGTGPFYADDTAWQRDLPLNTAEEFRAAMPQTHHLVLISGPGFHDEMRELSEDLSKAGLKHSFLACQHLKHHWNSGWIEQGVRLASREDVTKRGAESDM